MVSTGGALEVTLPRRPAPLPGVQTIAFRARGPYAKRVLPWPAGSVVLNCSTRALRSPGLAEGASGIVSGMESQADHVDGVGVDCIEVHLSPLVAAAVLGVPPGELNRPRIAPDDIWGPDAERLRSRLVELDDWPRRFALVHAFLADRYREGHRADPEIADAWRRIRRGGGRLAVTGLAADYGWGRTRFWSRFTAQVGMGPKRAARIVRFDHALRLISGGTDLAHAATACGYADQSHLNRDFIDFAATTPGGLRDDPLWSADPAWLLDDRPGAGEPTG